MTHFSALLLALVAPPALAGDALGLGQSKPMVEWIETAFEVPDTALVRVSGGGLFGGCDVTEPKLGLHAAPSTDDGGTLRLAVEFDGEPPCGDFDGRIEAVDADGRRVTAWGPMRISVFEVYEDEVALVGVEMWDLDIETGHEWEGSLWMEGAFDSDDADELVLAAIEAEPRGTLGIGPFAYRAIVAQEAVR